MALRISLLALVLLQSIAFGEEQLTQMLGHAECRLTVNRKSVSLSEVITITIEIQGPAPVEVEPIRPITDSPDWRVRSHSSMATDLPGGKQHWVQIFTLEPFQIGDVDLPIRTIRFRTGNEVRDWSLNWPSTSIRVTSSIVRPELSSANPVTGIEQLPQSPDDSREWWFFVGFAILVAVAVIAAWLLRRRATVKAPDLTPMDWIAAEFAQLKHEGISSKRLPHLANVLRQFVERQFQLIATRQTSAEFRATLEIRGTIAPGQIAELFAIISECDLVKFAGVEFDKATCESLLNRSHALIAAIGEVGQANLKA